MTETLKTVIASRAKPVRTEIYPGGQSQLATKTQIATSSTPRNDS